MSDTKRIVERAYRALVAGDVKSLLAVLDPAIELHEPTALPWGGEYHGIDGFVRCMRTAGRYLEPERTVVKELVADGDSVVAFVSLGVRAGERGASAAEHWRFQGGKVAELVVFWFEPTMIQEHEPAAVEPQTL